MNKKLVSGMMLTLLLIGLLPLALYIQPVKASGTIYIRADGSVDPPTAPIEHDGDVYTFVANIYDEIYVERSNVLIDGNGYALQGNESGSGFHLSGVSNVTITRTNVRGFLAGVYLNSSYCDTIAGNNILDNYYGVWLDSSSDNKFYHNNFIDNNEQVHIYTSGYANFWDYGYPSGGNYWSDYYANDSYGGSYQNMSGWFDFIADLPYVMDSNNTDCYPLMLPFILDWYLETDCVFRVVGDSMEPTILQNDFIFVKNTSDPSEIHAAPAPDGDLVVHRDPENHTKFILRRAIRKRYENGTWHFTLKGDNRTEEHDITMSLIIGKVVNLLRRFTVTIYSETAHPTVFTNSTLGSLTYSMSTERLSLNVTGLLTQATTSSCEVFIPQAIFKDISDIKIANLSIPFDETDYGTVTSVSFETHQTFYTACIIGESPTKQTRVFFNINPNPATLGQTITLKGVLIDEYTNLLGNETVRLYVRPIGKSWHYITSVTTNTFGIYEWQAKIPWTTPPDIYIFAVYYPGSETYESCYNFAVLIVQ